MTIINRQSWFFEPEGNKARLDLLGTAEELPTGDEVTIKGVTYRLMDGSCFRAVDSIVEYRLYHGGWFPQAEKGEYYNFMVDAIEGVESLIIPNGITSIGSRAFAHNSTLTSVTIPNSVKSIGSNAFYTCTSLATITINKPENSISGAPWGAPSTTQIVWNG